MSNKSIATIAKLGIDTGKIRSTSLAPSTRRDLAAAEMVTRPGRSTARRNAAVADRHGSLCWRTSLEPQAHAYE
jgi:hypothetical protein